MGVKFQLLDFYMKSSAAESVYLNFMYRIKNYYYLLTFQPNNYVWVYLTHI